MVPPHKLFREYIYPRAVANELITPENHESSTMVISSKPPAAASVGANLLQSYERNDRDFSSIQRRHVG
jgi:hypothetical protein